MHATPREDLPSGAHTLKRILAVPAHTDYRFLLTFRNLAPPLPPATPSAMMDPFPLVQF